MFVGLNPALSAMEVWRAYGESAASARFGRLDLELVLERQRATGVVGSGKYSSIRSMIDAQRAKIRSRRTSAQSMGMSELEELDDESLLRAVRIRLTHLSRPGVYDEALPEIRAVFDVTVLDDDVRNGGFHQYLLNHGATGLSRAHHGLLVVGQVELADIVSAVMAVAPRFPEVDLVEFERRYLRAAGAAKPGGPMLASLAAFIRRHLSAFTVMPSGS